MKSIRRGVFETNSSSTHSISIVAKEDYDKWSEGSLYFKNNKFYTREEAIENLKNGKWFTIYNPDFDFNNTDATDEILSDNEYSTINNYGEDCE